jgi:DNA-directed RNA polymerase specialized sigma24 family protein
MKVSEKIYNRYEYLAKKYASRIYSFEQLSFEYEDLVQEFRIKIFLSIKSYGRRWAKYRKEGYAKPVPIRYYLEAACSNKMRDFMKLITRENNKIRIDEIDYDFGIEEDCKISNEQNKFIVNDIDLLEGLTGKERSVFSLYLRGHSIALLTKVYFNNAEEKKKKREIIASGDEPFGVTDIIEMQKEFLIRKYGNELQQKRRVFSRYNNSEKD